MLELYKGALPSADIYARLREMANNNNNGALCLFEGIVRVESHISALSFDIYEPLLTKWFSQWQNRAKSHKAQIYMAHSLGDVKCTHSSYICGIIAAHRKEALALYEDFIEDFKANAPIWKYDVIDNKRIYALNRSKPLKHSGIFK